MRRASFVVAAASVLLFLWLSMPSVLALPPTPEVELISNATLVFRRAVDIPSAAIPPSVMRTARALAVFPGAINDGTAYCGVGIASARGADSLHWTPPAVITLQGEIPVRLDVDAIDFVLVALTPNGVAYLKNPAASLIERIVVAPGPIEQNTPTKIDADLLGYMQFGDFFASVTFSEFSIREMKDANARIYGKPYATADVFREGFTVPVFAQIWRNAVASYFREMS